VKTLNHLRQELLAKRLDLHHDSSLRDELEFKITEFLNETDANCVGIYWPIKSEFDLRPLALDWCSKNPKKKLALPIVRLNEPLIFGEWNQDTTLVKGPQNINEPLLDSFSSKIEPDLLIIPCLGWSLQNHQFWRIGYGGGYYDRTIAEFKKNKHPVKTVGVGYKALEVKEGAWRPQSHDQALDLMIVA
jgi:5,10-methenyltetrahydrofolate synthetase